MNNKHTPMSVEEATAQPGMVDKIAAARRQNEADFAEGEQVAQQTGLNSGQLNHVLLAYRQQRNEGKFTGSFEEFVERRIEIGHTQVGG